LARYGVNVTKFPIVLVQIVGDLRCSANLSMGTTLLFINNRYFFNLQKMVNGGPISHWACFNFSKSVQENVVATFCFKLTCMCHISWMVMCSTISNINLYWAQFSFWANNSNLECVPRAFKMCSYTLVWGS
jgi:hypothetical protein